jgi:hypothetical protein
VDTECLRSSVDESDNEKKWPTVAQFDTLGEQIQDCSAVLRGFFVKVREVASKPGPGETDGLDWVGGSLDESTKDLTNAIKGAARVECKAFDDLREGPQDAMDLVAATLMELNS